jgi:hypothetical protein
MRRPKSTKARRAVRAVQQIDLGTLPPFEYGMLRVALNHAVQWCEASAEGYHGTHVPEELRQIQLWEDAASERRALRARFGKSGRRGGAKR